METIEVQSPNGVTTNSAPDMLPQCLSGAALRRLQRLQARVDGATEVAQAAVTAHNVVRDMYQTAFVAACEDAGIEIPGGPHDVEIDWASGSVRFVPK